MPGRPQENLNAADALSALTQRDQQRQADDIIVFLSSAGALVRKNGTMVKTQSQTDGADDSGPSV